jgi:signal transduction histidine kinase
MFVTPSPIVFLLMLNGLVSLGLALYAWQQRQAPGALPITVVGLGMAVWALGYAGELAVAGMEVKLLAAKIQYVGIVSVPVGWLVLAQTVTRRRHWLTRGRALALTILPVITLALVWTNEAHGLIWRTVTLIDTGLDVSYGFWFWVHSVYSYLALLAGTAYLIDRLLRSRDMYRWQIALLVLASLLPWLGNAVYLLRWLPIRGIDPTPIFFSISLLAFGWDLFRYRLLDLMPIARKTVVDSLADGVIVCDQQGRVVDINPAARVLLGHDLAIGTPLDEALAGWPELLAVYASGVSEAAEIQFDHRRWFDVAVHDLTDDPGRMRGRVIVVHDVTRAKESARELAAARDRALAASQLKSQLLAKVGHELRTPLGAILGYAEILDSGAFGPLATRQKEATERVIHSTHYLTKLVDDLLDQSQLEGGRVRLETQPMDVRAAVERALDPLVPQAEKKGLAMSLSLAADLPHPFHGDPGRVQQIVSNLVSNAIKFTPAGRVEVEVNRLPEDGIRLEVRDTGIGVDAEAQRHLYEPFWQADQDLTKRRDGYGLGLAIVDQLVHLMGGTIRVTSQAGQGTCFQVELPSQPTGPAGAADKLSGTNPQAEAQP